MDASGSHREAISVTSGLRLAVLGYRDWMKQRRRKERMLPGEMGERVSRRAMGGRES